tara:strand:- start:643 stop:1029 length:387 start_codon:yes stop_codon:yes gene_type:complete
MIWSKNEQEIIQVANDAELLNRNYYLRLWVFCRNLPFNRHDFLEELTNIFRVADSSYRYQWQSGKPYDLPEIEDDVFPDPDMRWYSEFLLSDPTGIRPKIRSRMLERLRILDLYARVKHPLVARHFGR